jgi:hypothetical protein
LTRETNEFVKDPIVVTTTDSATIGMIMEEVIKMVVEELVDPGNVDATNSNGNSNSNSSSSSNGRGQRSNYNNYNRR